MNRLPPLPLAITPQPIPPVLHLVWVGSAVPSWVEAAMERWKEAVPADWQVKVITDATLPGTPLERIARALDQYFLPPRALADVLRLYALSLYGGWYFDVDCVLLRPLPGDVAGMIYTDSGSENKRMLSNGACGFAAGHPFLANVVERGKRALDHGTRNEHYTFGPHTFFEVNKINPVTCAFTIEAKCTEAERRTQAAGGRFDLTDLRERHPLATVVHIGLPRSKKGAE